MNRILVDVTEKSRNRWTIIGTCPHSVAESGGLYVYRGSRARVVDSQTDEVIVTGRSLHDVLSNLAHHTGMPVEFTDEIACTTAVFRPRNDSNQGARTRLLAPHRQG